MPFLAGLSLADGSAANAVAGDLSFAAFDSRIVCGQANNGSRLFDQLNLNIASKPCAVLCRLPIERVSIVDRGSNPKATLPNGGKRLKCFG